MPTILGTKYLPTWDGLPPHMSPEDYEIWKRYKPQIIKDAQAVYYDVGLGGQITVPPGTTSEMARMWFRNTQKRIDVLLDYGIGWIILELRVQASSSAIGRLLHYRDLWNEDPPDKRPVLLRLVTNLEDKSIRALAQKLDIDYIVA